MDARTEILRRIHSARVPSAPAERPMYVPAPVTDASIEQFTELAADYRATLTRCGASEIPDAVAAALRRIGGRRVVVPADLSPSWQPEGFDFVVDSNLPHAELDGVDAVLTGAALGIAETGTVVLDAGAGQGRRAITLIPDHHICVLYTRQVVAGVRDAVELLRAAAAEGRPLTWISGPSATSDIELSRVEGVHGPRNLDIILVDDVASRE